MRDFMRQPSAHSICLALILCFLVSIRTTQAADQTSIDPYPTLCGVGGITWSQSFDNVQLPSLSTEVTRLKETLTRSHQNGDNSSAASALAEFALTLRKGFPQIEDSFNQAVKEGAENQIGLYFEELLTASCLLAGRFANAELGGATETYIHHVQPITVFNSITLSARAKIPGKGYVLDTLGAKMDIFLAQFIADQNIRRSAIIRAYAAISRIHIINNEAIKARNTIRYILNNLDGTDYNFHGITDLEFVAKTLAEPYKARERVGPLLSDELLQSFFTDEIAILISRNAFRAAKSALRVYSSMYPNPGVLEAAHLLEILLTDPPIDFSNPKANIEPCTLAGRKSEVHAVLIGIDLPEKGIFGPATDLNLIQSSLKTIGVNENNIIILRNEDASSTKITEALKKTVDRAQCDDRVVLYWSGVSQQVGFPSLPNGWQVILPLWGVTSALDLTGNRKHEYIKGIDLAEFAVSVRNKRAFISLFFDTSNAAGLGIQRLLDLSDSKRSWNASISALRATEEREQISPLAPRAGDFAVYYASAADGSASEVEVSDGKGGKQVVGRFSYATSRIIQTSRELTVAQIAKKLASEMQANGSDAIPIFEGNNPDFTVFLGLGADESPLDIEIISPPRVAGTNQFEFRSGPILELVGRIPSYKHVLGLLVNGVPTDLDTFGQFSQQVLTDKAHPQIDIVALYDDNRIRKRSFDYLSETDLLKLVENGARYALVIGVSNYKYLPHLTTPHKDVEDVARVLRELYGFKTSILGSNGTTIPLELQDPTQKQIVFTLNELRKHLTENDSLIIYFGGHGQYLKQTGEAFWIPSDAELDNDYTWLSAHDVVRMLRSTEARSILVVSDSCFSGAFRGGLQEASHNSGDRGTALLKAAQRKSRIFISSGGTEPVKDDGCNDHSVFACAFLRGLRDINMPIFSSAELFYMYLVPEVSGKTQQQPERHAIRESEHDNGEFIFLKVAR